jgi:branched-chain amino acid transport system ATP-binding protein
MADALLSIRNLSKSYGALAVTDDVCLDIPVGELHAIIGPNGAGKTSLIQQLSGATIPDAGHILFDGRDITHLAVAARVRHGLARSFQITSILAGFTVLENVALAVQARSGSSFRFFGKVADEHTLNEPAREILHSVGLGQRASLRASQLSHGEKRQLEIALALATAPKLLLLDEPLAGVGREESEFLIGLLQKLRSKVTILLIEHDMDAVFALADRISVLVYGRIIASGTARDIRDNAQVRAAYLGDEKELI